MKGIRKILAVLFCLLLGGQFIFSAYSKLYPIELLEYSLADAKIFNWFFASVFARILIGVEFILGISFLLFFQLKKTILVSIFILSGFSIYLVTVLYSYGNTGNCGCFGNMLNMSPGEALLKNIVFILLSLYVYFNVIKLNFRYKTILMILLFIGSVLYPFLINPPDFAVEYSNDNSEKNRNIPLHILYESKTNVPPKTDITKGKYIVAFLSLTCEHCRIAAKKLNVIKRRNKSIPIFYVFNGNIEVLRVFKEDTRTNEVPYTLFNGAGEYIKMSGLDLPAIYFVNNSKIEFKKTYFEITQNDIENWLNEK